ncbi:unnamed protein product [Lactuca saligna]|uniref:CBF1-interacting co-repressor CIR N-terminal domain-containing protein n=1 Tax=Lactuca saligna TaxID=75948 RepID=A0AA35ZE95_LACSI|nr:unnamed protein product [Lactuca saligna]
MALKFLNKKGWHMGSLRNIENVWKAEQKHDAEQKKLEKLQKQIHEEREKAEFRQLQEQADLVFKNDWISYMIRDYPQGRTIQIRGSRLLNLPHPPPPTPQTGT